MRMIKWHVLFLAINWRVMISDTTQRNAAIISRDKRSYLHAVTIDPRQELVGFVFMAGHQSLFQQ